MLNILLPRVAFSGGKKSNTFQVSRVIKNENRSHIKILAPFGNLSDNLGGLSDTSPDIRWLAQEFHNPFIIQIIASFAQFLQSTSELWGLNLERAIATLTKATEGGAA